MFKITKAYLNDCLFFFAQTFVPVVVLCTMKSRLFEINFRYDRRLITRSSFLFCISFFLLLTKGKCIKLSRLYFKSFRPYYNELFTCYARFFCVNMEQSNEALPAKQSWPDQPFIIEKPS